MGLKKHLIVVGNQGIGETTAIKKALMGKPDVVIVDDISKAVEMQDVKTKREPFVLHNTHPLLPTKKHSNPIVRDKKKIHRNDPCQCGSGIKYKKCHGRL